MTKMTPTKQPFTRQKNYLEPDESTPVFSVHAIYDATNFSTVHWPITVQRFCYVTLYAHSEFKASRTQHGIQMILGQR